MYEGIGNIKAVAENEFGGVVVSYDIQTSGGQSGAPIRLILPEEDGDKLTIGVHTWYNATLKCNLGTIFTQKLQDWIDNPTKE